MFADWLEDTGEPHNVAWAEYLRMNATAQWPTLDPAARNEIQNGIRARFDLQAKQFVRNFELVLQLLPPKNIRVRLEGFRPPRSVSEHLPISFAFGMNLVPLACEGNVLALATPLPTNDDLRAKLEFCLNRDIVLVGAAEGDIRECIERLYGNPDDHESIDS